MSKETRKTPANHLARNKRHYLKMLAEGRCCTCGQPDDMTRQGRVRCAVCAEKARKGWQHKERTEEQRDRENADRRAWAQMRRDAHVCTECGRQDKRTIAGKSTCLFCATRRNKRQKENWDSEHQRELRRARKERWIAAGLCSQCGHPKEEPDKKMCCSCRVRAKLNEAKRRIKNGKLPRGANGMCWQCNRRPAIEGKKLCRECYEPKVENLRAIAARRKERSGKDGEGNA